jgi:hypothetical protein
MLTCGISLQMVPSVWSQNLRFCSLAIDVSLNGSKTIHYIHVRTRDVSITLSANSSLQGFFLRTLTRFRIFAPWTCSQFLRPKRLSRMLVRSCEDLMLPFRESCTLSRVLNRNSAVSCTVNAADCIRKILGLILVRRIDFRGVSCQFSYLPVHNSFVPYSNIFPIRLYALIRRYMLPASCKSGVK